MKRVPSRIAAGASVVAVLAFPAAGVAGSAGAGFATAGSGSAGAGSSCNVELVRKGSSYKPVSPAKAALVGAKLSGRGLIRCERAVVCKQSLPCIFRPGKVLRPARVHRLRGIGPRDALVDPRTHRVYVDTERCNLHFVKGAARCGRPVPLDPVQAPPPAYLLASTTEVSIPQGEYCWSADTGTDVWVRACVNVLPPWLRSRFLPLVIAEPGASVRIALGFEPNIVRIVVFRASGVYVSRSLTPSADIQWEVANLAGLASLPGTSFLEISAGRLFHDRAQDFVRYVARLEVRSRSSFDEAPRQASPASSGASAAAPSTSESTIR